MNGKLMYVRCSAVPRDRLHEDIVLVQNNKQESFEARTKIGNIFLGYVIDVFIEEKDRPKGALGACFNLLNENMKGELIYESGNDSIIVYKIIEKPKPKFKTAKEMRELYKATEVDKDIVNTFIGSILEGLENIIRLGGNSFTLEIGRPLLSKEKYYISETLNELGYGGCFEFNEDYTRFDKDHSSLTLEI